MLWFVLDVVFGLLIGSRKADLGNTALMSLAAGVALAAFIATVSWLFGSQPFNPPDLVLAIPLSGVVHAAIVFVCAFFWRRREKRGWSA
jgi:hypothetical protein